jgi:hypothetical protein
LAVILASDPAAWRTYAGATAADADSRAARAFTNDILSNGKLSTNDLLSKGKFSTSGKLSTCAAALPSTPSFANALPSAGACISAEPFTEAEAEVWSLTHGNCSTFVSSSYS